MVEKKCLYCGKKYSATRVSSKYCSSRCRSAYFRENNRSQQRSYFAEYRLKNGINPRGMIVEHRKCLVCGKGFGITNEQLRKKYCSFSCYKSTLQYKFYKSKNGSVVYFVKQLETFSLYHRVNAKLKLINQVLI